MRLDKLATNGINKLLFVPILSKDLISSSLGLITYPLRVEKCPQAKGR